MLFKLTTDPRVVIRLDDGASIPVGELQIDSRAYAAWLAIGNIPLPADPDPIVTVSSDQLAPRALIALAKLILVANPGIAAQLSPAAKLIISRATDV